MDKLIEELLELHCKKCSGTSFGCNVCSGRKLIEEVLKRNENLIIYFQE